MKQKKKVKKKLLSLSKVKVVLEKLQKELVIKTYGRDCYTCPAKFLEGANCQLGHVPWPRSRLGPKVKFDPRYTRIQCFRCNIHGGGMGGAAMLRMMDEGIDVKAMWAESEAEKGKLVPTQWYREQITSYQKKLAELGHT